MKFNHVNLTVPDVSEAKSFFETYFGLRCIAERGRNGIAVMVDETGFIFTLNNFERVESVAYPGGFHIGFMQDSREEVDAIFERLQAGGFDPKPPREFHGAWTFYMDAPGGITVEVGHQERMPGARTTATMSNAG